MIKFSILLFFSFFNLLFAQNNKGWSVTPSAYYTFGEYTVKEKFSNDYSAFLSVSPNKLDYLVLGFDYLKSEFKDSLNIYNWNYLQKSYFVGIIKEFSPFYFKINYAHISGEFDYKGSFYDYFSPYIEKGFYKYQDYSNLINSELTYRIGYYFLSASYTLMNQYGVKNLENQQIALSFGYSNSLFYFAEVRPIYSDLSDGRSLFGAAFKFSLFPNLKTIYKLEGFLGKRAYYFNPESLTIFNQDETQMASVSLRFEYLPINTLRIITSYQHTVFYGYSVNYFIFGVKLNFL